MTFKMRPPSVIALAVLTGCASTVSSSDGGAVPLDVSTDVRDASLAEQNDADGTCGPSDPRCSVLIDPGDRVVWVDQDLSPPASQTYALEWNRFRYGVRLSPYRIGRYEVTNEAYVSCVRAGACTPAVGVTPPVSGASQTLPNDYTSAAPWRRHPAPINWEQALSVCRFWGGDLPTKAQWQYAADGGDNRRFPWGDEPRCAGRFQFLWWGFESETFLECPPIRESPITTSVDSFAQGASPFGVFQMLGNVAEAVYPDYSGRWIDDIRARNGNSEYPLDPPPDPARVTGMFLGGQALVARAIRQGATLGVVASFGEIPRGARCVWPAR